MNQGPLNFPQRLDYGEFAKELADAQYQIGLLEGSQRNLRNPSLLIAPLTAKEAAVSSKIEGTQSTASDVFVFEAGGSPRFSDTAEVSNYRKAMVYSMDEIKQGRIISKRLIENAHKMLLDNVRHRGQIGKFREGPVWIAEKSGDPIEKAIYVPPEYFKIPEYIENFLSYIDFPEDKPLVKVGMLHYQFEAIHPFEDGNGRIGRLLIPLLMYHYKLISLPIIYLSGYLDSHRDEYIDSLHAVDKTKKYEPWLRFFFKAIVEQSKENQTMIDAISQLYENTKNQLKSVKSPYVIPLLDYLFMSPVFSIPRMMRGLKASRMTSIRLIDLFLSEKLITTLPIKDQRAKLFAFHPLLNILK